jgi:hypothetical protein
LVTSYYLLDNSVELKYMIGDFSRNLWTEWKSPVGFIAKVLQLTVTIVSSYVGLQSEVLQADASSLFNDYSLSISPNFDICTNDQIELQILGTLCL